MHALIQSGTGVVLTIHSNLSVLSLLSECTFDAVIATHISQPNYRSSDFLENLTYRDFYLWTWDKKARVLNQTLKEFLTDETISASRLVSKKAFIIASMIVDLERARHKGNFVCDYQEYIYTVKRQQAQRFKDSGYDNKLLKEIPYVLQYADLLKIDFCQAANEILLKAQFYEERLSKTEYIRMKYYQI